MLVNDSNNDKLVNESHLGNKLNKCIHEGNRSSFSLMLAILTDNVCEHPQFIVPKTDASIGRTDEEYLRELYNVTKPPALALNSLSSISDYNQAQLVAERKLTELNLTNILKPKPLGFRDDTKFIEQRVLNNTSLHCQERFRRIKSKDDGAARLNFKAKEWLNVIHETKLQSATSVVYI